MACPWGLCRGIVRCPFLWGPGEGIIPIPWLTSSLTWFSCYHYNTPMYSHGSNLLYIHRNKLFISLCLLCASGQKVMLMYLAQGRESPSVLRVKSNAIFKMESLRTKFSQKRKLYALWKQLRTGYSLISMPLNAVSMLWPNSHGSLEKRRTGYEAGWLVYAHILILRLASRSGNFQATETENNNSP